MHLKQNIRILLTYFSFECSVLYNVVTDLGLFVPQSISEWAIFSVFLDFLLGIWTWLYYALKVASGKNYANQVSSF